MWAPVLRKKERSHVEIVAKATKAEPMKVEMNMFLGQLRYV